MARRAAVISVSARSSAGPARLCASTESRVIDTSAAVKAATRDRASMEPPRSFAKRFGGTLPPDGYAQARGGLGSGSRLRDRGNRPAVAGVCIAGEARRASRLAPITAWTQQRCPHDGWQSGVQEPSSQSPQTVEALRKPQIKSPTNNAMRRRACTHRSYHSRSRRRRRALPITETEESAMAAAAKIGDSRIRKLG